MTVVIADTSPINYLILIDYIQLLPKLYRRVVIPVEVFHELSAQGAPPQVSAWISNLPQWIEVRAAIPDVKFASTLSDDELDAGELAALRLASSESG